MAPLCGLGSGDHSSRPAVGTMIAGRGWLWQQWGLGAGTFRQGILAAPRAQVGESGMGLEPGRRLCWSSMGQVRDV
jgi:hypothetical protein